MIAITTNDGIEIATIKIGGTPNPFAEMAVTKALILETDEINLVQVTPNHKMEETPYADHAHDLAERAQDILRALRLSKEYWPDDKLLAVKTIRQATGLSLLNAKNLLEAIDWKNLHLQE